MTSTSTSDSSSLVSLKAVLARCGPSGLAKTDLQVVLPHLDPSGPYYSMALAIMARSTSLDSANSSQTLVTIQDALESSLSGTDSHELVQGLSLLSCLLQVSPTMITSLFSPSSPTSPSTRIIKSLTEAVEHITSPLKLSGKGKDKQVEEELALVELLSLASNQPQLGALVESSGGEWMEGVLDRRGEERLKALAGVAIAKLRLGKTGSKSSTSPGIGSPRAHQGERAQSQRWNLKDTGELLVDLAVDKGKEDERTLLASLEGLAYLTLVPDHDMKRIASQPRLLGLLSSLTPSESKGSSTPSSTSRDFAVATLLNHLTTFPAPGSKDSDAHQVERLKRFAAAGGGGGDATTSEPEPVEEVITRVSLIARHSPSLIPTIRSCCISPSLQTRRLAGSILHSLVSPQSLRGQLLQAGVPRLLLTLIRNIPTPFDVTQDLAPVQALAKLLITANPLLIFGPTPASPLLLEASTALTLPLNTINTTPLLATFESLMALTNIASLDPELTDKLARLVLRDKEPKLSLLSVIVDQLLLQENLMVRRAATELVCNLVGSEPGIEFFEPTQPLSSSPRDSPTSHFSSARLHILLALSSSEDVPTRLASSGALTSLVYSPSISTTLAKSTQYLDLLLGLLYDDEAGVRHRAYEVWRGLGEVIGTTVEAGGEEARKDSIAKLEEKGVWGELKRAQQREKIEELRKSIEGAIQQFVYLKVD